MIPSPALEKRFDSGDRNAFLFPEEMLPLSSITELKRQRKQVMG